MIFALSQTDDMRSVFEWVFNLQEKIRQTQALLSFGSHVDLIDSTNLYQVLRRYHEELYVLMSSIRELKDQNARKNSIDTEWKLTIQMDKLVWIMLSSEKKEAFARWNVLGASFE